MVVDGEIIAITVEDKIGRLWIGQEGAFRVGDLWGVCAVNAVSSSFPVRVMDEVMWMRTIDGQMVVFNLKEVSIGTRRVEKTTKGH